MIKGLKDRYIFHIKKSKKGKDMKFYKTYTKQFIKNNSKWKIFTQFIIYTKRNNE